jgi:hypothetical protein
MKRLFAILVTLLTAVASQVQGPQSTSQQLPMTRGMATWTI